MYYYPVSAVLTECLILSVVEQQDSYGYEISQTVKMVASIKESTLYPICGSWRQVVILQLFPESSRAGSESIIPSQKPGVISWNI